MPRNFDWLLSGSGTRSGARFWLQTTSGLLALLNCVALFFYLAPPGGTRRDLERQRDEVERELVGVRQRVLKLQRVVSKVQTGHTQSVDFERDYFLPKRRAYASVVTEIQRMAKASGMQERDAVYSEEPVEGSADLIILNNTANYEGTYANLMRFLFEVDQSPNLLMLENLQAAPQQRSGQIAASIRFQTIVQEGEGSNLAPVGGQQ